MSKVVSLLEFKAEKQYKQFYWENLNLAVDMQCTYTKPRQQSTKDIEREMRLGYMRIITEAIEKNFKN